MHWLERRDRDSGQEVHEVGSGIGKNHSKGFQLSTRNQNTKEI